MYIEPGINILPRTTKSIKTFYIHTHILLTNGIVKLIDNECYLILEKRVDILTKSKMMHYGQSQKRY